MTPSPSMRKRRWALCAGRLQVTTAAASPWLQQPDNVQKASPTALLPTCAPNEHDLGFQIVPWREQKRMSCSHSLKSLYHTKPFHGYLWMLARVPGKCQGRPLIF